MLRISWFFISLGIPTKIRFDCEKGVNIQKPNIAKLQNASEIHPTLNFIEFDT